MQKGIERGLQGKTDCPLSLPLQILNFVRLYPGRTLAKRQHKGSMSPMVGRSWQYEMPFPLTLLDITVQTVRGGCR